MDTDQQTMGAHVVEELPLGEAFSICHYCDILPLGEAKVATNLLRRGPVFSSLSFHRARSCVIIEAWSACKTMTTLSSSQGMDQVIGIVSLRDGSSIETNLDGLSRNLAPDTIVTVGGAPIGLVTRRDFVFFVRTWAGSIRTLTDDRVLGALRLVDRWLRDEGSVGRDELLEAAAAARVAASAVLGGGAAARAAAIAGGEGATRIDASESAWAADMCGISYRDQGRLVVAHLVAGTPS